MFPLKDNVESLTFPIFMWMLIVLNTLAFLFELSLGDQTDSFITQAALVPAVFFHEPLALQAKSLLASMFLHGGWGHLFGNMWFLYIFGDNVEDRFGHVIYLIFYIFSGFVAGVLQGVIDPTSQVPVVGASGAISGVLGAYIVFFPRARVLSVLPLGFYSRTVEVPAVAFLGIWFLMQLFPGVASLAMKQGTENGGVAFFAHIGGFAAGVILALIFSALKPDNRSTLETIS